MAFIKSIFETAASSSKENITGEILIQASNQVISYYKRMTTSKERAAGFKGFFERDIDTDQNDIVESQERPQVSSNLEPVEFNTPTDDCVFDS